MTYLWYVKNNSLALVEDGHTRTIEDTTTKYDSITTSDKKMRVQSIALAQAFGTNLAASSELPIQFHEAILFKVISMGYQDPRHADLNMAQYFNAEYEKSKKEAKKYAKRNNQTGGYITPQEF